MSLITLIASAALAHASPAAPAQSVAGPVDLGSEELSQGRPMDAIVRIRADRRVADRDPAVLINLGTAFAKLGDPAAAAAHYRQAIVNSDRYDLELSDGRRMDSRRAARLAIRALARRQTLAHH